MNELITKEEYNQWWSCPTGLKLRKKLEENIIKFRSDVFDTAEGINNHDGLVEIFGRTKAWQDMLDMTYEDLMGIETEEEETENKTE